MVSSLQINDPVHVQTKEGRQLEGVVAFLGPVKFAEGDDWVGVRLTGASVGLGKNDGTLQEDSYFDCPPNSGLFVKVDHVSKRSLSRLEELRLRRELATAGSATGSTTSTAATAPSTIATKVASPEPSRSSKTPPRESTTDTSPASSTLSKLEELRQRRAALKEKKEEVEATPLSSARSTPVRERHDPRLEMLQKQLQDLQTKLSDTEDRLNRKERDTEDLQQKLSRTEQQLREAKEKRQEQQPSVDHEIPDSLKNDLIRLGNQKQDLEEQLQVAQHGLSELKKQLQQEQDKHREDVNELVKARAENSSMKSELDSMASSTEQRTSSDASHYKERAKLQAELSAARRQVEEAHREKQDLESTLEELTLDKEQLQEEKEALQDQLEELKLDAETAQMEMEELRVELQESQAVAERVTSSLSEEGEVEDKVQAVSVQNARLREALIRLREQTSIDKIEWTKQLRTAEKEAQAGKAIMQELEELRALKLRNSEEINDLKDMVEQNSAFEGMVEDLSDRVLGLEEDNAALRQIIRELEEAAELTAEMEEIQADELKAMARDLESRETIIQNLEQAIKMQRRREDDFNRTISNYRTTVDTLKQEKQLLLELKEGGEGEKNTLLAKSQTALARAANLVADAATMRKREAQAIIDKLEYQMYRSMCLRFEVLLPQTFTSREVSAIRGEMLASKVVSKAAKSLEGIAASFEKVIQPSLANLNETTATNNDKLILKDEARQQIAVMLNQSEFARVIVSASSDILRLLAAGQWPDILSSEESVELGSILNHSILDLDYAFGSAMKLLKEEGNLTPEQSNIGALQQVIQATKHNLQLEIEREDRVLVPSNWTPPGLTLLVNASLAKFLCMGSAASLSVALSASGLSSSPCSMSKLYSRVEQASIQARNVCLRFANLDVKNIRLVEQLSDVAVETKAKSEALYSSLIQLFENKGNISDCERFAEEVLRNLGALASMLRAANMNPNENESFHALSPETDNTWVRVSQLARSVRLVDGDEDDVNFIARARAIEQRLEEAIENEPKLLTATKKVANLEKNLASRSKETAMLNARLSELEKLLAKSNTSTRSVNPTDLKSSEELNSMKEENRVLLEAMDVLQRQVDEYENEIRSLKDFKSPGKRGPTGQRTPRRALTSVTDIASPNLRPNSDESLNSPTALEATIFRPALQNVIREAARWKSASVEATILNLPPLILPSSLSSATEELTQLSSAWNSYRIQRSSIKMVDLRNHEKLPRTQLRELTNEKATISRHLEEVVVQCRGRMNQ